MTVWSGPLLISQADSNCSRMRGKREIYSEGKCSRWVVIVVLYCKVVSGNLLSTVFSGWTSLSRWVPYSSRCGSYRFSSRLKERSCRLYRLLSLIRLYSKRILERMLAYLPRHSGNSIVDSNYRNDRERLCLPRYIVSADTF